MGKVILPLAARKISPKTIFDRRFVIECCETFHLHWRNLRLELSHENFLGFVKAFEDGIRRWREDGSPASHPHFEMGRLEIAHPACSPQTLSIELCENLYRTHESSRDSHFLDEGSFVHMHYRDLRFEMSINDFVDFAQTVRLALEELSETDPALRGGMQAEVCQPLEDMFTILNAHNILYVVLRNWDNLPESVDVGPHSDLDLLVHPQHVEKVDELWNAVKTRDEEHSVQRKVPVLAPSGEASFILVDVRSPGDGYFPDDFAHHMLSRRVKHKMFYVLPPREHFLSLLYHVIFHKGVMSLDYHMKLASLSGESGLQYDERQASNFKYLGAVIKNEGVRYSPPHDPSVLPRLPFLFDLDAVLSSRLLEVVDNVPFHSRIYLIEQDSGKRILKQATGDLAEREFGFLSELDGPHFPRVYSCRREEGYSVCEMEFVVGYPLREVERFCDETDSHAAREFISECLDILAALRGKQITHRDIHLDNILVRSGSPVLLDFGWAVRDSIPFVTPPLLGAEGRPPDGSFDDVYSMGVALNALRFYFPEFGHLLRAMTNIDLAGRVTSLDRLKEMLDEEPDLQTLKQDYLLLVDFHCARSNFDKAESILTRLLAGDPNQVDLLILLGKIYLQRESLSDAKECFSNALSLDPESAEANYILATILARESEIATAIHHFEVFLSKFPDHSQAHNEIGVLYYQAGDAEHALTHMKEAVRTDAHNITAQKNLADMYLEMGEIPEAIESYQQVLLHEPNDVNALLALAGLLIQIKRFKVAAFHLNRVLAIDPHHRMAHKLLEGMRAKELIVSVGPSEGSLRPHAQCAETGGLVASQVESDNHKQHGCASL